MDTRQPPDPTDPAEEREGGLTLARVGRRGESQLLAFLSIAAAVFVAVAIVKPWAGSTPPGSPATTSTLAAATQQASAGRTAPPESSTTPPSPMASEMLQGYIVVQSGELTTGPGVCADGKWTALVPAASEDPSTVDGSYYYYYMSGVDAPLPAASPDPLTGLQRIGVMLACSDETLHGLQSIVPSPPAP